MYYKPSEYTYLALKESVYTYFPMAKYLFFILTYVSIFFTVEIFLNSETELAFHLFSSVMALIVADYLSSELFISILKKIKQKKTSDNCYEFSKSNYFYLIPVIFFSFLNIFYLILFVNASFFEKPTFLNVSSFFALTLFLYIIMRITINKFITQFLADSLNKKEA